MAKNKGNLDTPPGVEEWEKLASIGDCRRLFRWAALQVVTNKMDSRTAGVLGQLGMYALKTLEISDLAVRVDVLEKVMKGRGGFLSPPAPSNATTNGTQGTPEALI